VARIAPAGSEYGAVTTYEVGLDGSIVQVGQPSLGPGDPTAIELGSLNADGFEDLIVAGTTPAEFGSTPGVFVYAGDAVSESGFSTGGQLFLSSRPLDLTIGDFNLDGISDFAVAQGQIVDGAERGQSVRRFNNVTGPTGNPVFESGPDDVLFGGQGVRRLQSANLDAVAPDDLAVLGERNFTSGGTAFTGGGNKTIPFAGQRIFRAAATPDCEADLNQDGQVDARDLMIVLNNWGSADAGDINGDEIVDTRDLTIVLGSWNGCEQ
jgi:hypothetical protein